MPALYFLVALVLVLLAASLVFMRIGFFPHRYTFDETARMEIENGNLVSLDDFKTWPAEEVTIASPYGYTLSATWFPLEAARKSVILSHGITVNRACSIKYIGLFRRLGFNVLAYDNRYHGRSGGPFCSFGFFEKDDLKAVVDWLFVREGADALIGTHGESLGAAITLQHAAIDPRIRFAIADCSFSDLKALFTVRLREDYHLPPFPLLPLMRPLTRWLLHFDYTLSSPIRFLPETAVPVFFIHGADDHYIPAAMSEEMVNTPSRAVRKLYIAPGAGHACSFGSNPDEYQRQVAVFLEEIELIEKSRP